MPPKRDDDTPEVIAAFRPETATPEEVEALIDHRIGRVDKEIGEHLAAVEELRAERKRWLGVTGGRSRDHQPEGDGEQSLG